MTSDPQLPDRHVRAIYGFKALALTAILVVYWFIEVFLSPFGRGLAISLVVIAALLPTLVVAVPRATIPRWLLRVSLNVDAIALTAGIHLGGGVDNVSMPLLYTAIIGLAGMLLTRADTLGLAAASTLLYDAMVFAEYAGFLPHLVPYSRPPARQLGTVIPVNLFFFLFAWLVSYTVARIRSTYRRLEERRQEAVRGLSHDLKNPLAVIYDHARLLHSAEGKERDAYGSAIERAAQQALDLVSNVLDAAAFEGRPITPQRLPIQLNDLVLDVMNRYDSSAQVRRVTLQSAFDPTLPLVEVDPQLISRALANLLSNAIKYGGADAIVHVSTGTCDGQAWVRVRDSGAGISAAEQRLLFRPYSRTTSARGVDGSGLGLYIVRRIAEAHRGSVSVTSSAGDGATFTFSIPLAAAVG